MARDDRIRMPSGIGGITRYFDEYRSKFEFSPGVVIVLCVIVMVIVIVLHFLGKGLLQ
ncbi:preprotein translocase subunit Sec61beta [Candidatus Woesearchaeota archaeon]|nr:preprotein translocase subunit Sec61beta [Candidatus Woesearchaeota archaeon]